MKKFWNSRIESLRQKRESKKDNSLMTESMSMHSLVYLKYTRHSLMSTTAPNKKVALQRLFFVKFFRYPSLAEC